MRILTVIAFLMLTVSALAADLPTTEIDGTEYYLAYSSKSKPLWYDTGAGYCTNLIGDWVAVRIETGDDLVGPLVRLDEFGAVVETFKDSRDTYIIKKIDCVKNEW